MDTVQEVQSYVSPLQSCNDGWIERAEQSVKQKDSAIYTTAAQSVRILFNSKVKDTDYVCAEVAWNFNPEPMLAAAVI